MRRDEIPIPSRFLVQRGEVAQGLSPGAPPPSKIHCSIQPPHADPHPRTRTAAPCVTPATKKTPKTQIPAAFKNLFSRETESKTNERRGHLNNRSFFLKSKPSGPRGHKLCDNQKNPLFNRGTSASLGAFDQKYSWGEEKPRRVN